MVQDHQLVWIVRHGETEWSRDGRHTSRTDLELTPLGQAEAARLRPNIDAASFDLILCSPRQRARQTAEIAGLTPYETTPDLAEWDYGDLEGRTTLDIHRDLPDWSIWTGPWPGGETSADVAARGDRVIERVRSSDADCVALIGHGHFSRVLAARWVGQEVAAGRWLHLDTATVSQLGWDRGEPVLRRWNAPASAPAF